MAGGWGWHHERHFLLGERYSWPAEKVWNELKLANTFGVNLLLNLGPRWDGSIEPSQVAALVETGDRIRREGYPAATGEERDKLTAQVQLKLDRNVLQKIRAREFGRLRAIRLQLTRKRGDPEYKATTKKMNQLLDLGDPENRRLIDQWYEDHPADWFVRGKQFLKTTNY